MAPEILRAIAFGDQADLMTLGSASDIWYFLGYLGRLELCCSKY